MSIPSLIQSTLLIRALNDIALNHKSDSDVDFTNSLITFINEHKLEGQGDIGFYGYKRNY